MTAGLLLPARRRRRFCSPIICGSKLPTFLREYEKVAAEAAREGLDHVRFLLRLAELELIDRERRMVERRIRAVHFSAVKSFDTFDFTAIPSLNQAARSRTRALRISHRPRQCYCSG
jgi:DNA replication protein DnaC